jgi:hypothetical protein
MANLRGRGESQAYKLDMTGCKIKSKMQA